MTDSGIAIHPALGSMYLKESESHVKVVIKIALFAKSNSIALTKRAGFFFFIFLPSANPKVTISSSCSFLSLVPTFYLNEVTHS